MIRLWEKSSRYSFVIMMAIMLIFSHSSLILTVAADDSTMPCTSSPPIIDNINHVKASQEAVLMPGQTDLPEARFVGDSFTILEGSSRAAKIQYLGVEFDLDIDGATADPDTKFLVACLTIQAPPLGALPLPLDIFFLKEAAPERTDGTQMEHQVAIDITMTKALTFAVSGQEPESDGTYEAVLPLSSKSPTPVVLVYQFPDRLNVNDFFLSEGNRTPMMLGARPGAVAAASTEEVDYEATISSLETQVAESKSTHPTSPPTKAAEPTKRPTPRPTNTPSTVISGPLELLDISSADAGLGNGSRYVYVEVRNITSETLAYVQLDATCRDSSGSVVATGIGNSLSLAPGDTTVITIIILNAPTCKTVEVKTNPITGAF